jgi:2-methylisocitrate lyase-like PEP mutase family enzyme
VDRATIEGKLRIALAHRQNASTFIIGRTDSLGVHGMDEALRRAESFLKIGVDGVFVAGLKSMQDYERVGKELRGARLSAAIFETPGMPWPTPRELAELGYAHVSYPATLLFRITAVVGEALRALRDHANGSRPMNQQSGADNARAVLDEALELGRWQAIQAEGAATGEAK